jgi:hypothetical protein
MLVQKVVFDNSDLDHRLGQVRQLEDTHPIDDVCIYNSSINSLLRWTE